MLLLCLQPCVGLRLLLLQLCCHRSCARCERSPAPAREPRSGRQGHNLPSSYCGTLKALLRWLGASCIQGAETVPARAAERAVEHLPGPCPWVVCPSVSLWQLPELPAVILSGCAVLRGWHCSVGAAQSPAAWAGGSVSHCKPKIPASLLVGQQCSGRKCRCKWRHKQLEGMADASREGEEAAGDRPQARTFPCCPFLILASPRRVSAGKAPAVLQNQPFTRQGVEAQLEISTHPKIMGCQGFDGLPGLVFAVL